MSSREPVRSHDTLVVYADGKPLERASRFSKTPHPPAPQECGASSQLPQALERLQNSFDLLAAFLVLPAEEGGEGFGIRSYDTLVVTGDELANDGDLVGEAVWPDDGGRGVD